MQDTYPADLETVPPQLETRPRVGFSLFWRTFFLLVMVLIGCIVISVQAFRTLEFEPQVVQRAEQLASLVNLSRTTLKGSDASRQVGLTKALVENGVRLSRREPHDKYELFVNDAFSKRIGDELIRRTGVDTIVAKSVNGTPGLWVGFTVDADFYWLQTYSSRFGVMHDGTWLSWLLTAAILSLLGAALITRLLNRPLKQLSFATSRVHDGDFATSLLDEQVATSEIRKVNIGFNRMAEQLAKIEEDRVIMLAGISHDLRTPLARLRLEAELSVADADAREHMAADISQLDAIIAKFLDYAQRDPPQLVPVSLNAIIDAAVYAVAGYADMRVNVTLQGQITAQADEVELSRVIANLLENARRYGKTPYTGIAVVDIAAKAKDQWVLIKVRDHGTGVATHALNNLTKPFFRGDAARTAATGAGLGLAIVEKSLRRMGGMFELANTRSGGLVARITLRRG